MGKYLNFHNKCMKTAALPHSGLCQCLSGSKLKRFVPTTEDTDELYKYCKSASYWGSGVSRYDSKRYYEYTTLRQTIVLFMAAMNKEL